MQSAGRDAGQRAPKVGSTKSRGACTTCLRRRVRCDQTRPLCANCTRLGLQCAYGTEQRRSDRLSFKAYEPNAPIPAASTPAQASSSVPVGETPFPESEERRLLELRLLHHWMTIVSRPFPTTPAPRWGELWRLDLPLIAFRSPGVHSALMAMSATHLLRAASGSDDFGKTADARDRYFAHALSQQRETVAQLTAANVDEASFAALLISLNAFSMLRERSLVPYSPPINWLEMGYGAGVVMRRAAELLGEASPSKAKEIIETTMPIHQNFEPRNVDEQALRPYQPLLQQITDADELFTADESDACAQAIKVIGTLRKAIRAGEPEYVHLRRICMFPFLVTPPFIELVRERRPPALVVLAHFFAAIASTEALAYLGNTGNDMSTSRREVVAIREYVSEGWHGLMIWPVDEVRAQT